MDAQGTYQRLDESQVEETKSEQHEMVPLPGVAPVVQPQQLPPHYAPYSVVPPPAVSSQQASNNNVVVATQPTASPPVTVVEPRLKQKPMIMIVTIVLTVVCLVQQCWPVLVCMVPALIAAVVGFSLSDSGSAEQRHTSKAFHAVAVCCNIGAIVYYALMILALIISLASYFGVVNRINSACNYYSSNDGCYDDEYGNEVCSGSSSSCY